MNLKCVVYLTYPDGTVEEMHKAFGCAARAALWCHDHNTRGVFRGSMALEFLGPDGVLYHVENFAYPLDDEPESAAV